MNPLSSKLSVILLLFPGIVAAHTGVSDTSGFLHGLAHPISGIDHLLAMFAVGLWAAQIGGRALWFVPSTFVSLMVFGGWLGFGGFSVPYIEQGIILSVLVLGSLIAGAFKFPLLISVLLVGFFAVFHGYAHGAEIPFATGALSYTLGFVLSTATLHLGGMSLGLLVQGSQQQIINRIAGGMIAIGGFLLALF